VSRVSYALFQNRSRLTVHFAYAGNLISVRLCCKHSDLIWQWHHWCGEFPLPSVMIAIRRGGAVRCDGCGNAREASGRLEGHPHRHGMVVR
jgi:hypothetical protein